MTQTLIKPETVIQFNPKEKKAFDRLKSEIPLSPDPQHFMDKLWDITGEILPHDRIGIAFIDKNGEGITAHLLKTSYEKVEMGKGYYEGMGRSGLRFLRDGINARIIPDLEAYLQEKPESKSTKLLLEESVKSSLALPMIVENKCVGFIFFSSRNKNVFTERHANLLLAVIRTISYTLERLWHIAELEKVKENYMSVVGFVSHEMKSPLATAQTTIHTYLDGYFGEVNEAGKELATGVGRLLEYMHSLITNYLGLSQLETGEMRFHPQSNINFSKDIADFALRTIQARADANGSNFRKNFPKDDIIIHCDIDLLRIVMVNLLDNAIKYSPQNADIDFNITIKDRMLHFEVINPGPGFTEEQGKKLFKKFSRLHQKGLKDRKGTGLGLYLSWWIVQKHQGIISASSQPGEWTKFEVEIPLETDLKDE